MTYHNSCEMKGIIFIIANIIVSVAHFILPYKVYDLLKRVKIYFYSIWISKEGFYSIGRNNKFCCSIGIRSAANIAMGDNNNFGYRSILATWQDNNQTPILKIGNNCVFGEYCHITALNSIVIGDNILTGRWVVISDNSHGRTFSHMDLDSNPNERSLYSKGPIIIGNNVWIGDKVAILAGVTIGEGSIIGANSVVTKDIPPFSIAGGVPAKVLKTLD